MAKESTLRELVRGHENILRAGIVDIDKGKLETERVLIAESPEMIHAIIRHVQACQDQFVTPDSPRFAPLLPPEITEGFLPALQITAPRQRAYFLDRDGIMRELKCEVRQEMKPSGHIKQTTKVGNGATASDSTMDRDEQPSRLLSFGFNVFAIGNKKTREALLDQVTTIPRPVLNIVTQRHRLPYYPEGNPDVLIEMALEPIMYGQTFTGFVWRQPKIDLEIIKGPKDKAMRHSILAREEQRLLETFSLKKQLISTASPGFEEVLEALKADRHRARFDSMAPNERWWEGNGTLAGLEAA